jgi:hypothetical protein
VSWDRIFPLAGRKGDRLNSPSVSMRAYIFAKLKLLLSADSLMPRRTQQSWTTAPASPLIRTVTRQVASEQLPWLINQRGLDDLQQRHQPVRQTCA